MTAGPLAGPASAYPILSTPASICFSEVNDVYVPGLIFGKSVAFGFSGCASAELLKTSWAAARVMAAVPKNRRRSELIVSDIFESPRLQRKQASSPAGPWRPAGPVAGCRHPRQPRWQRDGKKAAPGG